MYICTTEIQTLKVHQIKRNYSSLIGICQMPVHAMYGLYTSQTGWLNAGDFIYEIAGALFLAQHSLQDIR